MKRILIIFVACLYSLHTFAYAELIQVWQTTERISVDSSGVQGNAQSLISAFGSLTSMSTDGRYIVYTSLATNLVTGDTNGVQDIFLKDRTLGTTVRVSTSATGAEGNGLADYQNISPDGRYISFASTATNLVTGDTNGQRDVFLRDMLSGTLERISVSSTGSQGVGGTASISSISSGGRYVAFSSNMAGLVTGDTNNVSDIFVRDRTLGTTVRINVSSTGLQGNGLSQEASISADGRYVAYESDATNLVTGDTNGIRDTFLTDTLLGTTIRVNVDSSGNQATGTALSNTRPTVSANGRYVFFSSAASNLVSGDTNNAIDVFMRDTLLNTTTRITTDSYNNQTFSGGNYGHISPNGLYASFASDSNDYVSGDTNGTYDIFIKSLTSGTVERISMSYTGLQSNATSFGNMLLNDGRTVMYYSFGSNLVSGDTNAAYDVFVAQKIDIIVGAPTILSPTSGTAFSTTNNNISVYGTGFSGYRLDLYNNATSGLIWSGLISSTGYWATTLTGYTGSVYTLRATQTYLTGEYSSGAAYTMFTNYTPIPTIISPGPSSLFNTGNITVTGAGISGGLITLSCGTGLFTGTVNSGGLWSLPITLPEGFTIITGSQTIAGIASSSVSTSITVDITAPMMPTINTPVSGSILTGSTPTISGTGEIASTLIVKDTSGSTLCSTTINGSGFWSCTPSSSLPQGLQIIYANAIDSVGNTSSTGYTTFTIDNINPSAPTITSPSNNDTNIAINPTIQGMGEAGATVIITLNGTTYTSIVATNGSRSIPITNSLNNLTQYTITAYQVDTVNNMSTSIISSFTTVKIQVSGGGGGGGGMSSTIISSNPTKTTTNSTSAKPANIIPIGVFNTDFDQKICYEKNTKTVIDQNNGVSDEFKAALQVFTSYGLTKYNGTKDFRPFDKLTRAEAARFFSEFASNVLCRTPHLQYKNAFTDLASADQSLVSYIIKSYEWGIFKGDPNGNFRPNDIISPDEVTTIVMRLVLRSYLSESGADWAKAYKDASKVLGQNTISSNTRENIANYTYNIYKLHYEPQDFGYILQNASNIINMYK